MARYIYLLVLIYLTSGCTLEMNISSLGELSGGTKAPQITFKVADGVDSGETVPLEISGGVPPYQYSITGPATFDPNSYQLITNSVSNPTTAVLTIVDAIGQSLTQSIPIRSAQIKYKAIEYPDTAAGFSIRSLSFTSANDILMLGSSISYGSWRVDKLKSDMNASPIFLENFNQDFRYSTAGAVVLALNNQTYLAMGTTEIDRFNQESVTIRRTTDGGLNWSSVYKTPSDIVYTPVSLINTATGNIFALLRSSNLSTIILRSEDYGSNWSPVYSSASELAKVLRVADDGSTLFLGYQSGTNSYIRKSTDQGQNWGAPVLAGAGYIADIVAKNLGTPSSLICWVGHDGNTQGTIKLVDKCSQNEGTSWSGESLRPDGNLAKSNTIKVANSGDIFVTGNHTLNARYLRKSSDNGVTWSAVTLPDASFQPDRIEQDRNGDLYLVGSRGPSKVGILKSTDSGLSWNEWQYDFAMPLSSYGKDITTSSQGTLFSVGNLNGGGSIRKSSDNGSTWVNQPIADSDSLDAIKAIGDNVFVLEFGLSGWRVWKTADNGSNWNAGSSLTCPGSELPSYKGISGNSSGHIFVVGNCSSSGVQKGSIYRSTDNGTTWEAADVSYQWKTNKSTSWNSVTQLPTGEILVFGIGTDTNDKTYWLLRKSSDHGQSWVTIDAAIEYAPENHFHGEMMIAAHADKILIAGRATVSGATKLILRLSEDTGGTWRDIFTKAEDTDWYTPDLASIYLDQNGVYLAYYREHKSTGQFHLTIEKSRNFTDWFTIGGQVGGIIKKFSPCGLSLCGIGLTGSSFSTEVWTDFKIE